MSHRCVVRDPRGSAGQGRQVRAARRALQLAAVGGLVGALVACGSPDRSPDSQVTLSGLDTGTAASEPAGPTAPVTAGATTAPASGTPSATPTLTHRTVTVTRKLTVAARTVKDSSLAKGETKVITRGRSGVERRTYRVTLQDGVEVSRTLLSKVVVRAPVARVVAVGTKRATPSCDPNYSGACVPIASDVDCAGGSGNGPAYVEGPVTVIGTDIYGLDSDGDGIGCE